MKRKIISIDENLCNGCGRCASACPEGAIQMIDGRARLVSEIFCDGLGACIGDCPVGAITTVELEAVPYDEIATLQNIIKQGPGVIAAHLAHLKRHGQTEFYNQAAEYLKTNSIPFAVEEKHACGCPHAAPKTVSPGAHGGLTNWPVLLHLINPAAPFFDNADLLVAADCTAFAAKNFRSEILKNKKLIIFCPKLDHCNDAYVEKLAQIFALHSINSVTVLRMEVPCCGGTLATVREALRQAGIDMPVAECVVSITGETTCKA